MRHLLDFGYHHLLYSSTCYGECQESWLRCSQHRAEPWNRFHPYLLMAEAVILRMYWMQMLDTGFIYS